MTVTTYLSSRSHRVNDKEILDLLDKYGRTFKHIVIHDESYTITKIKWLFFKSCHKVERFYIYHELPAGDYQRIVLGDTSYESLISFMYGMLYKAWD